VAAKKEQEEVGLGEELALVISSETTVKTLVYLVERAGSPKDVGLALGIPTPNASHHVKKLERLRIVELIEEKEVGGAIQHIYRAVVRPIMSTEKWEKLGLVERHRYSIWIVRMILADAAVSFDANLFDAHSNRHLSRMPMVVDEAGFNEVAEIQNRALNEMLAAEVASAERRVKSGDAGMNVIAAMMCFELPEPSGGLASSHRGSTAEQPGKPGGT
jgi:hypothetical protein